MNNLLSSNQNPKIKYLSQLREKSKFRKQENKFVIEGQREIDLAIKGGYQIQQIYYCLEIISEEVLKRIRTKLSSNYESYQVTLSVYQKIAYRQKTEGIVAIAESKSLFIKDIKFQNTNPLILIAEAPEKPGNIGALLRTADAAAVDAVLIANPKTDLFNPNIIRSSVGCIFTNQVATGTTKEIIEFLIQNHVNSYGAALQASVNYSSVDYTKPTAIIVGTEDVGLSEDWLAHTTQNIVIPMGGSIDSMNVSVAAGILIFEAKRQRGFSN